MNCTGIRNVFYVYTISYLIDTLKTYNVYEFIIVMISYIQIY